MRPKRESGFALLLVFLMAAVIAISLYLEIPRVAFETQRQKEQLLIERGEQYKRAIYMFWKANQRYPAKMEDLYDFNGRHFLRHKYIDPMTGKEEWRLVHIQNGVLTDSATTKQKQGNQKKEDTTAGQYVAELPAIAQSSVNSGNPGNQTVNLALRRRPGDTGAAAMTGSNPAMPGQPGAPGALPGQQFPPGMPGMPGQVQPGAGQPAQGNTASTGGSYVGGGGSVVGGYGSYIGGASTTGSQPNSPAQPGAYPGQQGFPGMSGMPGSTQPGGVYPGAPGMPGQQQPGAPGAPNPATQMIQQILTSPRPMGPGAPSYPGSGIQNPGGGIQSPGGAFSSPASAFNNPGTTGAGGQVIGGGIAGIASTADSDSIMIYNDQTNYSDWEFIFDPTKVKPVPNPLSAPPTLPTNQAGGQSGGQSGTFGGMNKQPPSSFGPAQ